MAEPKLLTLIDLSTGIWPLAKSFNPITNKTFLHDAVPLWIDGENVFFTEKGVTSMPDTTTIANNATIAEPSGVIVAERIVDATEAAFVYLGNLTKLLRVTTAGVITDVTGTPYTGDSDDFWSIIDYGTQVFATNNKDQPQLLNDTVGTNNFANLGADFTTAKVFVRRGPHILAFNTSINDRGFVWANAKDPTDFTPTSENDAGDLIIRELESAIMAAAPLGDRIAVYGIDSVYLVSFIAGELTFGYKPAAKGIGASTIHSVVPVGKTHFGISNGRAWQFDGANVQFIDEPFVKEWLKSVIKEKVVGYHHSEKNVVIWHFLGTAASGQQDNGIMYDYVNKTWSPLNFGRNAGFASGLLNFPITVETNRINREFQGLTFINGRIRTKPLDMGVPDQIKHVDNLRINYNAPQGGPSMQVRVGTQDGVDDAITFSALQDVPEGNELIEVRVAGRYITIEIDEKSVSDLPWELFKIEIYGSLDGEQ